MTAHGRPLDPSLNFQSWFGRNSIQRTRTTFFEIYFYYSCTGISRRRSQVSQTPNMNSTLKNTPKVSVRRQPVMQHFLIVCQTTRTQMSVFWQSWGQQPFFRGGGKGSIMCIYTLVFAFFCTVDIGGHVAPHHHLLYGAMCLRLGYESCVIEMSIISSIIIQRVRSQRQCCVHERREAGPCGLEKQKRYRIQFNRVKQTTSKCCLLSNASNSVTNPGDDGNTEQNIAEKARREL